MDSSIIHLPPHKQQELARDAQIIREGCPGVGLVLLFGSYARGDWKKEADLAPDRPSGHPSDYDILAVIEDSADCDTGTWQLSRMNATGRTSPHMCGTSTTESVT